MLDPAMESLWDVSVGSTAHARDVPWRDERVAIERAAGDIPALAA
jgi:hypothetical protein